MKEFSRKIKLTDPILPYMEEKEILDVRLYTLFNNCHWGGLKLLYSEIEFLVLCSKYIDIESCLIVYIGAATGYRLKHLFIKLFPNTKYLLYDPNPFEINEDENFTIKTGEAGWFGDDKIEEVLKIANGREILYISDIRITSENLYEKERLVHNNLQDQQRWGILMNAKFMLLKFRMFFYQKTPDEIDFINNRTTDPYRDRLLYDYDEKKHNDNNRWFLYLDGDIYTQIYAGRRSAETRLFVKRDGDKFKMRYYDNIQYEGLLNYFNIKIRSESYTYENSAILSKYIPGMDTTYTSASEYYIISEYLKYKKKDSKWENIIKVIIYIYMFMNKSYVNNLIMCINKNTDNKRNDVDKKVINEYNERMIKIYENQFKNLRKCEFLTSKQINNFIKSYDTKSKSTLIYNGRIKFN